MSFIGENGLKAIASVGENDIKVIATTGNNLENSLIFGSSAIAIGLISTGLLLAINKNQNEYSRQKHNLILKKIDKKCNADENLELYNIDLNCATQSETQYSYLFNALSGGVITCFLYIAFVSYKKIK